MTSLVLRNNVTLLQEPVVQGKSCAIGFWFLGGSRAEPENLCGVTHFTEHLLFKGTSSLSSYEIARSFDRMGGYVNAFTEQELVCLYCVVPSGSVFKAVEILCDMTTNSTFLPEEIERELKVIKSEIISADDDPDEASMDAVCRALWPNQKISKSISGTLEDVDKITRSDLIECYQKNIVHGKLIVSIAGNVENFGDDLKNLLEKLPDHQKFEKRIKTENLPIWKSGANFIQAPFVQEQFFKLYPIPYPVSEKQFYVFAVLNALIGDSMSSRLFQQLREKGGYCYNVYSFFTYFEDAGFWGAYASSAKQDSVRIIEDLQNEIEKLKTGEILEDEIIAAREHLCGEEMISSEDVEFRMKRLAKNFISGYKLNTTEEIIEEIKKVSLEDLKTAVKMLFIEENSALVVYGPKLPESKRNKILKIVKK